MDNLRQTGQRVEALIEELQALANPRARDKAEELVRLLMHMYGAGLERILEIVDESGPERLFTRFAEDHTVSGLLVLHGLHPWDTETRVRWVLDRFRPQAHFVSLDAGVLRLNLEGDRALRSAIEEALEEAAPELERVDIEQTIETGLVQIAMEPAR